MISEVCYICALLIVWTYCKYTLPVVICMFLEVSLRTFPVETASSVRVAIRQKLNNAEKSLKVQLKHQSTSDLVSLPAFTPVDGIWAVMMVWRLRGKIITIVLCCIAYDVCWMWTVVEFVWRFTFRFCFFRLMTDVCMLSCMCLILSSYDDSF